MIDLDSVDLSKLEAVLDTDKGKMVVGFYSEQAPKHVRNFAELAQKGFYDGLAFHRVIRNFMIQGGCPNTREGQGGIPGTGGPGHSVEAEFSDLPHKRGVLSMARSSDPNSAGSQFFVVHSEHADFLDNQYTVFGYLKEGLDVLDALASVDCEFSSSGERSVPSERQGLNTVTMRECEEPAPAEAGAEDSSNPAGGSQAEASGPESGSSDSGAQA
ncbi:MAG: peptidylprolyl isomerase [Planctomycetota bacterium]